MKLGIGVFIACFMLWASSTKAQQACNVLVGAAVIAKDGKYLGKIAPTYDGEGIFTSWSKHGATWSGESIWASWSQYGGSWSALSPFSTWSSTPPALIKNSKVIAYLTVNESVQGGIDPRIIALQCYDAKEYMGLPD